MPLVTIPLAPGVTLDATELSARPQATMTQGVRWRAGHVEPIGGRQSATPDRILGAGRSVTRWEANDGRRFRAIGTHRKLYALVGGLLWDITPIRQEATVTNALATTEGSDLVTLTSTAHGCMEGDTVYIRGTATVGGLTIGGGAGTLTDPLAVTADGTMVVVTHPAHGLRSGDMVEFSGAATVGGIDLAGRCTIHVIHSDAYMVDAGTKAGLDATGGGAVSYSVWQGYDVVDVPGPDTIVLRAPAAATSTVAGAGGSLQIAWELESGYEDGQFGGGFGVGRFGVGAFGFAAAQNPEFNYPRTWSLDQWGEQLVANPRGGGIYLWALNASRRAALVPEAPVQCSCVVATGERMLVALGGWDGQRVDPLGVRNCDIARIDIWEPSAGNIARRTRLGRGGRIVAARVSFRSILVWTDTSLYTLQFVVGVGYTVQHVADGCGLAGPNAVTEIDSRILWLATDRTIMLYEGGAPQRIPCPVTTWLAPLASGQADKVVAAPNRQFNEIAWHFPAGSGENDRYVLFSVREGWWAVGTTDVTGWVDRSVDDPPMAALTDGRVVWADIEGAGDDGAPLPAWVRFAPFQLGEGDELMQVQGFIPDFKDLHVGVRVRLTLREWPMATPTLSEDYVVTPATPVVEMWDGARQVEIEVRSVDDGQSFWRLGAPRFDLVAMGQRR